MGIPSGLALHAWDRHGPDRTDDRVETARVERRRRSGFPARLTALFLALALPAGAETIRVGFLNAELERDGPGLLLRDILKGEDPDIDATVRLVADRRPDILVLSGFDYDHGLVALTAFRDRLGDLGAPFPHIAAMLPNAGLATAQDLDGDGRMRGARDAQGFGNFAGQGGIAFLSRYELLSVTDFNDLLWRDLPGSLALPEDAGYDMQRLASVGHLVATVDTPEAPIMLLTFHATPPVFDGPEDRNGRRNHDEAAFWLRFLEGAFGPAPETRFVLLGDANLDPADGDGRPAAITAIIEHPKLQDPKPRSAEALDAAAQDGGVNLRHRGDPALDTANWRDGPGDPGNLRVDYLLPSRDWTVTASGVTWGSGPDRPRHGLVWADLTTGP